MASTFAAAGEVSKEQGHHQVASPRAMRRSWSSNSSNCGQGGTASPPKCVCAPPTHARSFKCRLHRVNSNGHSVAPSTTLPQQPNISSSASTRTVEAQ